MTNISFIDSIEKTVSQNLLAKKGESNSRVRTEVLDKELRFENGEIYYKDNLCGNYNEISRKIIIYQSKCINHKGLNPLTSHPSLPKNATIEVLDGKNLHIIETDHLGRKIKLTNIFKEKRINHVKGTRENDEQTKAKLYGDEDGFTDTHFKQKDQGGHGTSASGGSLKEMAFIFPQAHKVNNSKEWKEIENSQRTEINRENVNFQTTTEFEYEGMSKRPSQVKSEITSKHSNNSVSFNNSNLDSIPILANKLAKKPNLQKEITKYISKNKSNVLPSSSNISSFNVSSSNSPLNLANLQKFSFKIISGSLALILVIILFLWIMNIFPFNGSLTKPDLVPQKETIENEYNTTDKISNAIDLTKTKLSFAKPLEDLTKSITDISEFKSIIENENTIPVIGSMFEFNSAVISYNGIEILAGFASEYTRLEVPNKVLIEGFTCTVGSRESNERLAEKRAENLKAELIKFGITESAIVIRPIGMQNFVSTNNKNKDLVLNRRCNVTILSRE